MPVGSDQAELTTVDHHQQAIKVITDVLLRHGVVHESELPAQELLRQCEARRLPRRLGKAREVLRGQCLQAKAAATCSYKEALVLRLQAHFRVFRQCAQDVEQLASAYGQRASLARAGEAAARGDLDLDIGREEDERFRRAIDEHVRQYRQRMAPLDDSANRGKRCQELVSLCFNHSST